MPIAMAVPMIALYLLVALGGMDATSTMAAFSAVMFFFGAVALNPFLVHGDRSV
jgi:hypothetical protein